MLSRYEAVSDIVTMPSSEAEAAPTPTTIAFPPALPTAAAMDAAKPATFDRPLDDPWPAAIDAPDPETSDVPDAVPTDP